MLPGPHPPLPDTERPVVDPNRTARESPGKATVAYVRRLLPLT
jgi:hypothetical protein